MLSRALAVSAVFACLIACGASPKRYALRGRVLEKDIDADLVTVSHDEVPGFMPSMTMQYRLKQADQFRMVQGGDRITADLTVDASGKYWLDHVVVIDRSGRDSVPSVTADELETGAEIPDVPLINQDGRTIHLSDFRGRAVLLTFIYTRCPFPNFCPLLSNEFAAVRRELLKTPGDYRRTHLISISLDPAFDKPPVLRSYGLRYLHNDPAGFDHWDFAATSPEDLKKLAAAFNLTYYEEKNQITHSLRTVLIAKDGAVQKVWSGNEYRKQELADALREAASS